MVGSPFACGRAKWADDLQENEFFKGLLWSVLPLV